MSIAATTTASPSVTTTPTTTTANSFRLPSIHELTGKSSNHQSSPPMSSPRSFNDNQVQRPVLPSLSLNTNVNEPTTFRIPPIKPMTPSSVSVNNSTLSTPTEQTRSNIEASRSTSLVSPPTVSHDKQPQALLPILNQPKAALAPAPAAAPQSASTPTVASPTFHLTNSHNHHHPHFHQQQNMPPPPSFQSPIDYNGGHGSPQYHQPTRSYSAPVPQYITHHPAVYAQSHYTVQHPNNHGLQMCQPYTIAEVVSKTANKCHRCGTTETPEWRRGPKGVRTLCNACGLFHAKLVKRKGAVAAAEEVLNNRVTKGKNGRRISSRKLLTNDHHGRENFGTHPGFPQQHHHQQQHSHHYPPTQYTSFQPNQSASPLQQPPMPPSAPAYLLHQQQLPPPPPNSTYVPQGYVAMPPSAVPINTSVHYQQSQVSTMSLVHH